MPNHEIVQETVNFNGERVDYQDWLKEPVFKYQLWSPLGAHVEALACIKQGLSVPKDVLKVGEADFACPDGSLFSLIKYWNGFGKNKRAKTEIQKTYYGGLTQAIAGYFNSDIKVNVHLASLNPEGNTAIDSKREMLRVVVAARLNQPDSGFQGA